VRISFGNGAIATLIDACFEPSRKIDYFVDVPNSAGVWATCISSTVFKGSIGHQIVSERRQLQGRSSNESGRGCKASRKAKAFHEQISQKKASNWNTRSRMVKYRRIPNARGGGPSEFQAPPGRMVSIRIHFLIPWLGAGPGQADAHAFTLSAPAAGWLSG